jgi:Acetyltransferase (GNAT) family
MEVVTLNALERRAGVGTLLMEAAAIEAKRLRCTEIRLTTTNDNLDALRFYQRRGLRLVALRPGAVDRARVEKPEIPRVGDYGIPLHDEIDLARRVLFTASIPGAEKPRMRHQTRHYCEKNSWPAVPTFKIFMTAARKTYLTRPRRDGPSWVNSLRAPRPNLDVHDMNFTPRIRPCADVNGG